MKSSANTPQPVGEDYLSSLRHTLAQSREQLAAITQSAERAASGFVAGGNLWVAGRQADFITEACHRAGGLMAMAPLSNHVPASRDVILYAAPASLNPADRAVIDGWRQKGVMVEVFCSTAGLFRNQFPLDTVINVAELWIWTGEFVAACARIGKMPVLYQSYGLPGGYDRAKKYHGKRFHDDLSIQPIPAGVLGNEYVAQIQQMLARIRETQTPKINLAAQWWREAKSATALVTGHIFPGHGEDPRAIRVCDFVRVPAREDKPHLGNKPSEFVIYLGYQFAPIKLLEETKRAAVKLVYTNVEPGEPAEPADNILYIDPAWSLADGCVSIAGYDIPILPASGIVQAAIYWTLISKAFP